MSATFDPLSLPERLNLGCGYDLREGFLNVDLHEFHGPDLVADVTNLAVLPSGRYVVIVAQDILEHLPRSETVPALREWNRLLAVGGVLELRVPSLLDLTRLFGEARYDGAAGHERLLAMLFGTQAYTGDTHLTSFTRLLLTHYLTETGFTVRDWGLRDEWLFEIAAVKAADVAPDELAERHARLLAIDDVDSFIEEAYRELLGRAPDPSGRGYWRSALQSGTVTARQVVETLAAGER